MGTYGPATGFPGLLYFIFTAWLLCGKYNTKVSLPCGNPRAGKATYHFVYRSMQEEDLATSSLASRSGDIPWHRIKHQCVGFPCLNRTYTAVFIRDIMALVSCHPSLWTFSVLPVSS